MTDALAVAAVICFISLSSVHSAQNFLLRAAQCCVELTSGVTKGMPGSGGHHPRSDTRIKLFFVAKFRRHWINDVGRWEW